MMRSIWAKASGYADGNGGLRLVYSIQACLRPRERRPYEVKGVGAIPALCRCP